MEIGYNFDDYYEEDGYWKLVKAIANRHNLDENTRLILRFCISDIYKSHGKLLPLTKQELGKYKREYEKSEGLQRGYSDFKKYMHFIVNYNSDNTMTIEDDRVFYKDIDIEYLSLIALVFKDYKHSNFDYPYYKHIGSIDLKKLIGEYPNLSMETIRNVLMYSKNSNIRDELLKDLNTRSCDYQNKVCKLIYPISMELISMYGGPVTHESFYNFKYHLAEEEHIFNQGNFSDNYLDNIYDESFNWSIFKKTKNRFNLYYLVECEYLFQDLYLLCHDIDDDKINNLLKFKEFAINNVPKVNGKIEKNVYLYANDTYTTENFEYPFWLSDTYKTSDLAVTGKIDIDNVDFHEKEVLRLKKMYLELIPMILSKNIDYEKILDYASNKQLNIFICYVFNNILSKEDLINIKNIILSDIDLKDLMNIYRIKKNISLQENKEVSNNRGNKAKFHSKVKAHKKTIYFKD